MATGGEIESINIDNLFEQFSKFGNAQSNGKTITLKNADKWMKQANLFDKKFTTTDTGISFAKFKTKQMDLSTFKQYIDDLCKTKNIDEHIFLKKLLTSGSPGTTATTKVVDLNVTDRLTDTSKYTGSHKNRFDSDGKGKGIQGRNDVASADGYVQGFKTKHK